MGSKREWSPAEDQYLRDNYTKLSGRVMAKQLGRGAQRVRGRMRQLGLPLVFARPKGSGERGRVMRNEAYLREHYPRCKATTIARRLGVSVHVVKIIANELGLKKNHKTRVGDRLGRYEVLRLARVPNGRGRVESFAHWKCCDCGRAGRIRLDHLVEGNEPCGCSKGQFTPAEDELLRACYGTMPLKELADKLGRAESNVTSRRKALGLEGKQFWPLQSLVVPGARFGCWTVVGKPFRDKSRHNRVLCRCRCGRSHKVDAQALYARPERCRRCPRRPAGKGLCAWGETKSVRQWLCDERCKARYYHTVRNRLGIGWSAERALETPYRGTKPRRSKA